MKVTLQDIATELNLSPATVSRSLRHNSSIHPATRAQVKEAALRLGYRGSSGRPRGKTETAQTAIGLLLHGDSQSSAQHEPNIVRVMEGVMAGAESQGFLLNIHTIKNGVQRFMDEDPAAVPSLISGNVCQAVILRGWHHTRDVAHIAGRVPVVSLGRRYRELNVDTVLYDDIEGVRLLVTRLIELGHRRLGWVRACSPSYFYEARQAGFVMGCLGNDLDLNDQNFFVSNKSGNSLDEVVPAILQAVRSGTTALVCANDKFAQRVIIELQNAGLRVPGDVSVTGFDALPPALTDNRQITSIDPQFHETGVAAVNLASLRMDQPEAPPQTLVIQGLLVPGETIGPNPNP